jgi:transketolase
MALAPAAPPSNLELPLDVAGLAAMARQNRLDAARMFMVAGNGHFGSCFSCAEIVTVLYFASMRVDPLRPDWPDRDRFILGKGHAAPALYSGLIRRGFIPEGWIDEYEARVGARLMTHPSRRYQPGVDASQGALGHGLSIGVGMALDARLAGRDCVTYVLMGDGETNEGSVWEAAASAAKFRLGNLVGIVDCNGLSVDGRLAEVMPMEPFADKWRAFGWNVIRLDGHDLPALVEALQPPRRDDGPPTVVLADTVKGKGVSFMEDVRAWHADAITAEQYARVVAELGDRP